MCFTSVKLLALVSFQTEVLGRSYSWFYNTASRNLLLLIFLEAEQRENLRPLSAWRTVKKNSPPPKKKVFAALAAVWGWSQGRSWRRFLRSSYGVIYVPSSTAISTTWTLFGCLCFFFFFAGVKGWVMSSCRKTIIKMQQVWVSNCCPLQHNFGLRCFYWTWSVIKKYQIARTGECFWIQVKLDCSTINHNQT